MHLDIQYVTDPRAAERLRDQGYEPVECSFASSIVGALQMDHHGTLSHLDGVAIRACRDHLGARKDDPRFVVTGTADADATFAIAALAGILPERPSVPLLELAHIINQEDMDPYAVDLRATAAGRLVLLWKKLASPKNDDVAFYGAVNRWRFLLSSTRIGDLVDTVQLEEGFERMEVHTFPLEFLAPEVAFYASETIDFSVLYRRAPVLVGYHTVDRKVRIGCRNRETAEALFGAGGLMNVFPHLSPTEEGNPWTGREVVGGSPRGLPLTEAQAREAAAVVLAHLRKK